MNMLAATLIFFIIFASIAKEVHLVICEFCCLKLLAACRVWDEF